jgi:hypothetical protein
VTVPVVVLQIESRARIPLGISKCHSMHRRHLRFDLAVRRTGLTPEKHRNMASTMLRVIPSDINRNVVDWILRRVREREYSTVEFRPSLHVMSPSKLQDKLISSPLHGLVLSVTKQKYLHPAQHSSPHELSAHNLNVDQADLSKLVIK